MTAPSALPPFQLAQAIRAPATPPVVIPAHSQAIGPRTNTTFRCDEPITHFEPNYSRRRARPTSSLSTMRGVPPCRRYGTRRVRLLARLRKSSARCYFDRTDPASCGTGRPTAHRVRTTRAAMRPARTIRWPQPKFLWRQAPSCSRDALEQVERDQLCDGVPRCVLAKDRAGLLRRAVLCTFASWHATDRLRFFRARGLAVGTGVRLCA